MCERVIMWLFTKHGFFSVVSARQGDGKQGRPIDTTRLVVRARVRGHLEALKKRWPEHLGPCDIRAFGGTDYAFRMFVDKHAWSRVLSELALETDYDNFKTEVARHEAGSPYEHALHDVWSVMYLAYRREISFAPTTKTGCAWSSPLRPPVSAPASSTCPHHCDCAGHWRSRSAATSSSLAPSRR